MSDKLQQQHHAEKFLPKSAEAMGFAIFRATAIAMYASYEQSLHYLYAQLLGVTPDLSGIAFFRINNARARLGIIERLLKKRHGDEFNLFWNSLVHILRRLDEERNQVVHWLHVENVSPETRFTTLVPPNFWDATPNTPYLKARHLLDFISKAEFFSRLLNIFSSVLAKHEHAPQSWHEMCRQPITYPLPDNHPLAPKR